MWIYGGDERFNTQPPPEVVQPPVAEPQPPVTVEPTVVVDTTTTTTDTPTTPTVTTTPTTPTNPVTPVNPDPPSSAPPSVGFAGGSNPMMPGTAADRVRMPAEPRTSGSSGWFGSNLSVGELAKAIVSGAGEGLYDVTIGAVKDSYNSGVEHMAASITAAQEGDYALAALHATATLGEAANLTLTAVGAGEGVVALRNAGAAAMRGMASNGVRQAEVAIIEHTDDAARVAFQKGMCFVAGTPIATAGGVSAIESLELGDRVLTDAPGASWTEVDPATWRTIRLRTVNPDNPSDTISVELLRPVEWMTTTGAAPDTTISLDLGEIGFHGPATVEAIEPAPLIAPGSGRVVLATFTRLSSSVLQVRLEGENAPLELTATHRLFSETRGWVEAAELQQGEALRTRTGTATVASVKVLPGTHRVYNVEVEAEHCYFAGEAQVLSHNSCAAKRHSPDQQALKELVDEATAGKKKLTKEQAETVMDWADEVNYPNGNRPTRASVEDLNPLNNHWKGGPHIHGVGQPHTPVQPGVKPR